MALLVWNQVLAELATLKTAIYHMLGEGEEREGGKFTGFQKAEKGIEASKYTVGNAKATLSSLFV